MMSASVPAVPPVHLVVVSWNTRAPLEGCLRSLAAEVQAGRARVTVVDNGSTDGSPELVGEFKWAELVRSGENLGYGAAVNRGAAASRSPWIAAANADVALTPGALTALLTAGSEHPRAGCLAPGLERPDGSPQHSLHPFPELAQTLAVALGLPAVLPALARCLVIEGRTDLGKERDVPWAHGALLLVRREAWEAVGGFDEAQWLYAEDLDLCWRLRRAGWSTRYVPSARVVHHVSAATTQAFGDAGRLDRSQRAAYSWLARRHGPGYARTVAAIAAAGATARIGWLRPAAKLAPARYAHRLQAMRAWARVHRAGVRTPT